MLQLRHRYYTYSYGSPCEQASHLFLLRHALFTNDRRSVALKVGRAPVALALLLQTRTRLLALSASLILVLACPGSG